MAGKCLKCGAAESVPAAWMCGAVVSKEDEPVVFCGGQAWAYAPESAPEAVASTAASSLKKSGKDS